MIQFLLRLTLILCALCLGAMGHQVHGHDSSKQAIYDNAEQEFDGESDIEFEERQSSGLVECSLLGKLQSPDISISFLSISSNAKINSNNSQQRFILHLGRYPPYSA